MGPGRVAQTKKRAARLGALILFLDETGVRLIPYIARTWALKGKENTPIFKHHGHWSKVSVIAAVSRSGKLYFQTQLKDFEKEAVVGFLKHLLRATKRRLIIVWDRASIHKNGVVNEFLEKNKSRIEAHFLPGYAPELNPVEPVNGQLKVHELKNIVPADTKDLHRRVRGKARKIQRNPSLVRRLWHRTPLVE